MQRFKPNDAIFVLPRFSHLYPSNAGVIVGAKQDPYRPIFNEYTVEFKDRSTATIFEFQIIEDLPNYQTLIARIDLDSWQQPAMAAIRGHAAGRQIVLQTPEFDVDMNINTTKARASIFGQVLERNTNTLLKNVKAQLIKDGMPISATTSDSLGVFKFSEISRGALNILITLPDHLTRILGAFQA